MALRCLLRYLCWSACLACPMIASAQTIQFGQSTPLPSNSFNPSAGVTVAPGTTGIAQPGVFDPYAPRLDAPAFGTTPVPQNAWPSTGLGGVPASTTTPWSAPGASTPGSFFPNAGAPGYATPPANTYPGYSYPQQSPGVIFPNGVMGQGSAIEPYVEPFRIFQNPRFSETWLYGDDDPRDVQIHDLEFAVTGALPQFLGSTQPLYITPTFLLHLWDGPQFMAADLPPSAYSAFLDFFWASDPARPLGVELGVAVGAFTDFDTFNTDSIRVIGEGFGVFRLTEQLTFKFGVWYLNRNDLKLLPAGGLVWQPNPQMKLDLLFPNPKYTQYLATVGTSDVWWYVSGEYGGGAWTIEWTDGTSDRVDINDIRVKFGVDWINQRNWRGYLEAGYVFDREVVYVVRPGDSFRARDTFLLGAGFSF